MQPTGTTTDVTLLDTQAHVLPIPPIVTQFADVVTKIAMGIFMVYFSTVELGRELRAYHLLGGKVINGDERSR